jgi:methyl-accepting chemotaxis protein
MSAESDSSLSERLKFLGMNAEALDSLRANKSVVEKDLPGALTEFYKVISSWPTLRAFFSDQGHMGKAKDMQIRHWNNIIKGNFGDEYERSILAIGHAHSRIGLEPRWYIGGYAHLTSMLAGAVIKDALKGPFLTETKKNTLASRLSALLKAVFLDMDMAISTYMMADKTRYEQMIDKMTDGFDKNVTIFLNDVSTSSHTLNKTSEELTGLASLSLSQSDSLASASEVSSSSSNIVASTMEELSASVQEINTQISRSSQISAGAVQKSHEATRAINELQESAGKIGDIIHLIRDVAEQTNLLALNATIEAARAGEAGKGFAVVAAEVKGLANQTASATAEISSHVQNVLQAIQTTVNVISDIGNTIGELNGVSTSISAAMEEQTAAIGEVVRSMQNAADSAQKTQKITSLVSDTAHSTKKVASVVSGAAVNLHGMNDRLRGELETFLSSLKAR